MAVAGSTRHWPPLVTLHVWFPRPDPERAGGRLIGFRDLCPRGPANGVSARGFGCRPMRLRASAGREGASWSVIGE